ncbi:MAG: type II CAAX endopeptidase family protein [Eubacteriales bacterium]|nr:type II CAAX endopeptidase family protein [Eubacteriales bacterium]
MRKPAISHNKKSVWVPIFATLFGVATLLIAEGVTEYISELLMGLSVPSAVVYLIGGVLLVSITYFLIKLVCKKILHVPMTEFRIGKIIIHKKWYAYAIALPVVVTTALLLLPGSLHVNRLSTGQILDQILFSLFFSGIGIGVVEEMIYRGVIMSSLEHKWGKFIAVLVPTLIFGLLNISKDMGVVDIIMLFIASICISIKFSIVTFDSDSIWPAAVVHGIWNTLMLGGILSIGATGFTTSIIAGDLASDSILVTGGKFGIEASIVTIIGYILFIIYEVVMMKRDEALKKSEV